MRSMEEKRTAFRNAWLGNMLSPVLHLLAPSTGRDEKQNGRGVATLLEGMATCCKWKLRTSVQTATSGISKLPRFHSRGCCLELKV